MKPLVGNLDQDVDVIPNPLFNPIQPDLKNEVILSPRPVELAEGTSASPVISSVAPIQGLSIPRLD
jgi:hypothetical protein